jgi:Ca-activated chloride channel family protein
MTTTLTAPAAMAPPTLTSRDGRPVLLRSVRVSGDLRGSLFESRVEQHFQNGTNQALEVIYTFPKQADAVLLGVDVRLGERVLVGQVKNRSQAEAGYELALVEGHSAILLELNASGSYTLNLGNLAPGEVCVITLHHARTLPLQRGSLRLIVPTVISPRYGDPVKDARLLPQQVPVSSFSVEHPFDLSVRLHGALARAVIASPSHPIAVDPYAIDADGTPVATVRLTVTSWLDRDFVLVLERISAASMALFGPELDASSGQVAALLSLYTSVPESRARQMPMAVKVLVDCSGSMNGGSIHAAIRALEQMIDRLRDKDRFSLTRFGATYQHRCRTLWPVTSASRAVALDWVRDLKADMGGTEMKEALESVLALAAGERSDVLLITDGQVWQIEEVIHLARQSGQRVFVVGIGADAREGELRTLAESTGGRCEFVLDGEDVSASILRTFQRLSSASHYDELQLRWPEAVGAPLWVSELPVSVFDGETMHLWARLPRALPAGQEVVLVGRRTDVGTEEGAGEQGAGEKGEAAQWVEIGRLRGDGRMQLGPVLARMRVAHQYAQWEVSMAALSKESKGSKKSTQAARPSHMKVPKTLMDEVLAAQLVTADTSFVLVHEREQALPGMPRQHIVQQMHTAGASGFGQQPASSMAPLKSSAAATSGSWWEHGEQDSYFMPSPSHSRANADVLCMADLRLVGDDPLDHSSSSPWRSPAPMARAPVRDPSTPRVISKPSNPPEVELSPAQFQAKLLKLTTIDLWPRTWQELRAMGMPASAVDAFAKALDDQGADEATLIQVMFDILGDWVWMCDGVLSISIDTPLKHAVMAALQGMDLDHWPSPHLEVR